MQTRYQLEYGMDNNTIFVRTSKGEDEMQSRTSHLPGDVKRALLMVDGSATFGEISKRAAPSMRASLGEMFQELEKSGFIQDKAMAGKIPKMAVPPNMVVPTKMATPHKEQAVDDDAGELDFMSGFAASPPEAPVAGAVKAEKLRAEAEEKSKQEIEAEKIKAQREAEAILLKAEREAARIREETARRAKEEAETTRLKAEQEARKVRDELETARLKAEQETKLRLEAAARERLQAEAARVKAEQEAAQMHIELEATRLRTEQEAKARLEAAAKAHARIKAEEEVAKAREEAELAKQKAAAKIKAREEAKQKAAAEAKAREEAERHAKEAAEVARVNAAQEAAQARAELEAVRAKAEAERHAQEKADEAASLKVQQEVEALLLKSSQDGVQAKALGEAIKSKPGGEVATRSTSATVLFFDVVGYTKQPVNKQIEVKKQFNQLVSDCLRAQEDGERIILDTGDGAAIGFLQHPEDALEVAMQFRQAVIANQYKDYPDLKVRIGIHLGPINVAKDMNGRSNMVGDGINDAQRVMSFAGNDQIYISRSYYDFVSRLSDEYANLFQYRGSQKDKHGREHPVYELVDALSPVAEVVSLQVNELAPPIKLEPFSFAMQEGVSSPAPEVVYEEPEQDDMILLSDIATINRPEEAGKPVVPEKPLVAEKPVVAAAPVAQQTAPATPSSSTSVPGTPTLKQEAKPVAQTRMPSEEEVRKLAEKQAKAWAEAEQRAVKDNAERAARQQHHTPHIAKDVPTARASRKPIPWGRLVGFVFMLGAFLLVLLVGALFIVPYVLPMRDYMPKVQQLLSARLHQPVHLGYLSGRILPTPRLELGEIYIGEVKQFQAGEAQINFDITGLFGDKKPISSVEFKDVKVSGTGLQNATAWLQQLANVDQYPVSRMVISQGTLDADAFQLTGVEGELNFNPAGKFTQANLRANAGKFTLGINAAPEDKLQVAITVRNSALPLLPNWSFDELNAKGALSNDELQISDFDARILGGVVQGNASINWRSGWRAQGALSAKTITMQKLSKLLDGNVEGSARFKMTSMDLAGLTDSVVLDGSFTANDGMISGMDIVETARMRSRVNMPGGRTHFDGLSGLISYANNAYHFKQVKVAAGVLNATATFDVTKHQLSGKVNVSLSMHDRTAPVDLQMGGAIDSPTLRYAP